jgi:phage tail sheath protein FI
VGTYGDSAAGLEIKGDDFIGSDTKVDPFELLKKEFEPTLVVIPDAIVLGEACYTTIYTKVLGHCANMQSRFGIFDLAKQLPTEDTATVVGLFRDKIGVNALNYGAAYYPWVKAAIVQPSEITFENIDAKIDLATLIPADETAALEVVKKFKETKDPDDNTKRNFHQALKATSPTYNNVLEEIRAKLNELPPSGAMAGLYATVDNSRGVWKAPANVSVSSVNAPTVNISSEGQESLNVDVLAGRSINVIRPFPGVGTLVWGGRTLDGNSQDWRYINVRRTMIMIEQSLKLATRAYVFEPNDANTWITVKSMFINFLTNLWKQGALAGSSPEQAFDVQIGLGSTMTATDILDGKMLITVKVAIVRPAEFIVITFQQQMQQS